MTTRADETAPLLGPPRPQIQPQTQDEDAEDTKGFVDPMTLSPSRRRLILAGLWLAAFLGALNSTMVATLLSSISSQFERAHQASWLGTSFLLATSSFTPVYGRLSNALGRRGANQLAVGFLAAGTLVCGLSKSMEMLVFGRFLAGMGAGGVFTTCSIITADMYTLRDRSMTQGIANIWTGLGMGLGGPFGGFVADRWGWRLSFLLQLPIFAASLLLSFNINYSTPGRSKSKLAVLKKIDWFGTAALLSFVLFLLSFLSFKFQSDYEWDDKRVIGTIALSATAFVTFIVLELCVVPAPVLAPFLLRQRVPVLVSISNMLIAYCNFAIIYHVPIFFELVFLTSSAEAGMHLLPNSIAMSVGSLFAGYYLQKTGKYKMLNVVFGILPTIATILVARLRNDSGWVAQWLSITTLGFGNAVVLQTTLIALLASVGSAHTAVAIGFGQLWRGIGQVSGVAVSSAVLQSILDRELKARITGPGSAELITKIRHSSALVKTLPRELQVEAQAAYAIALKVVFILAAISTFTAFLARLPIPELSLDEDVSKTPGPTPSVSAIASPSGSRAPTPARVNSSQDITTDIRSGLRKAKSLGYGTRPRPSLDRPQRRLSTYEGGYGADPEIDEERARLREEKAKAKRSADVSRV